MAKRLDKRLDRSVDNVQQMFDVMFECGVRFAAVTISRRNLATGEVKTGTIEATEKWYLYGDNWKVPRDSYPGSLNREFLKSTKGNQLRTALNLGKPKKLINNPISKSVKKTADPTQLPPLQDLINFHRLLFSRFYNSANRRWFITGKPAKLPAPSSCESLENCEVDSSYSSYSSNTNLCGIDSLESWSCLSLDKSSDESDIATIEASYVEPWEKCYLAENGEDKIAEVDGVANKIVYREPKAVKSEKAVKAVSVKHIPLARLDSFPETPSTIKYISSIIELTGATVSFILADITEQFKRIGHFSKLICCDIVWSTPVGESVQQFESAIQQTVDKATERWKFDQSYLLYISNIIECYSINLSTNLAAKVPLTVEVGIYRKKTENFPECSDMSDNAKTLHRPYWNFNKDNEAVASVQQLLLSKKFDTDKPTSFLMINLITTQL